MKEIPIHGKPGIVSMVDDADYERLSMLQFSLTSCGYPKIRGKGKPKLHALIIGFPKKPFTVDHIDGNPLNNQRNNLRICREKDNARNARKCKTKTSSKYKGVTLENGYWRVTIVADRARFALGNYELEEDAAKAYDSAAVLLFGEFARTNFRNAKPNTPDALRTQASLARNQSQRARYSGVCLSASGRFRAQINLSHKQVYLGSFDTFEAARASRIAADKTIADLKSKGVSMEAIAEALGHGSKESTKVYVKPMP